ncbi:MAG: ribosome maturation factor RimP [Candidatus Omnitrophota bacterium]
MGLSMDRQELDGELRIVIEAFLKGQNLDLVDFACRQAGKDLILHILVDRPHGGITMDECAGLNKGISRALDERGIPQEYILEVSSPGLDRPLKTKNDFSRCLKRAARFFFSDPVDGKLELEGVIAAVDDSSVYIDADGKAVGVPLPKIVKAKQIIN